MLKENYRTQNEGYKILKESPFGTIEFDYAQFLNKIIQLQKNTFAFSRRNFITQDDIRKIINIYMLFSDRKKLREFHEIHHIPFPEPFIQKTYKERRLTNY